ncbi:disulfide bond formation protein DsbA [Planococcus rifietoensis]|uniref:Disulfide bond formation protein DsbA n=1 Tax=Planococcus rifietoensis TaxID=200991 RepID=A0A0U2XGA1_9BACL|nr:DsbA family oxidoreductase [Planococcus rifietoensis]ALS75120.1 disulfide bond formation protein DsbA [Planococcus rifietoensis]
MKIEVWSDYVCPFCYIGKRTLEQALVRSGYESQAEITFKAYELDPQAPVDSNRFAYEHLAEKMGQSLERAKEMTAGVAQQAKAFDLHYDVENMPHTNTFSAHRLVKWAATQGEEHQLTELLMHHYFEKAHNISNSETLLLIVEKAGLDREKAAEVLDSDQFHGEVERDIQEAGQIGVQGVPFFVVNRKYAISGAQPLEAFIEALEQIGEEEGLRPALKPVGKAKTSFCTGDSCDGE